MSPSREVILVCEDELSAVVLDRLVKHARPQLKIRFQVTKGSNTSLIADIPKYVRASKHGVPHIVLTDLDSVDCAPEMLRQLKVPKLHGKMLFRIAVREVESWILADQIGFAAFTGLPVAKLHILPDEIGDPKQTLMNLVRRSKKKKLKQDILPAPGSSASKGTFYNDVLGNFARATWNVDRAARSSPSLRKALLRLGSF